MSYSSALDAKALKSRYFELVKSNHPDTGGDASKMAQITVAYERLANMTKYEWMSYHSQHSSAHNSSNTHPMNPYAARYTTTSPNPHYAFYGNQGSDDGSGNRNGFYSQSSHAASPGSFYGNGYYAQSRTQQQQAYWNFYRQRTSSSSGNGNGNDPFSKYGSSGNDMYGSGTSWAWNNPLFRFNTRGRYDNTQRSRFSSSNYKNNYNNYNNTSTIFQTGNMFVQVFIGYLIISVLFLFCYRRYRDGNYEDGWKMA